MCYIAIKWRHTVFSKAAFGHTPARFMKQSLRVKTYNMTSDSIEPEYGRCKDSFLLNRHNLGYKQRENTVGCHLSSLDSGILLISYVTG